MLGTFVIACEGHLHLHPIYTLSKEPHVTHVKKVPELPRESTLNTQHCLVIGIEWFHIV